MKITTPTILSRTDCRLVALLVWGLLFAAPSGVRADVSDRPPQSVDWVLPASANCAFSRCPRFIPTGGTPDDIVGQGILLEVRLPLPGELLIPAPGEYRVLRRVDDVEEQYIFNGPASIFLYSDGSYDFISPGIGSTEGEHRKNSALKHGLPPVIAGVEGTQFDYLVSPYGIVYIRVTGGLVGASWPEENRQYAQLRAGESLLVDPHHYTDSFLQRTCWRGEDSGCSGRIHRRFYSERADTEWERLALELESRKQRAYEAPVLLEEYYRLLEQARGSDIISVVQARDLYATYTDLLVPCSAKQVSAAAQELAAVLPGHSLSEHGLYLAWLKARVRGDVEESDKLYTMLTRASTGSTWRALMMVPEIIDSAIEWAEPDRALFDPIEPPPVSK